MKTLGTDQCLVIPTCFSDIIKHNNDSFLTFHKNPYCGHKSPPPEMPL